MPIDTCISIRSRVKHARSASSGGSDSTTLHAQKAYTVCEGAANRIISIAVAYAERFAVNRCPAFFTYYIFTASIMHVTRLLDDPQDVQASGYLAQAMKILDAMSIVWPSAFRAYELLDGAQHNIQEQRDTIITQSQGQTLGSTKRPADASTVELQHQTQLVYPSQPLETAPIHRSSDSHPPAPAYSMYSMEPPSESLRPRPRPIGYQSIRTPRLLSNVSYSPAPFFPPTGAEQIQRPMSTPGDESWPTESYTSNASRSSFPPFSGHDPRSGSSYPIEAPIHVHQRPQSPHSGPDYPFHPQQGITAQHHQEIWSGYSTGTADPFGDPSALSASLYTVPLLAEDRVGFNPEQYTPAQSVQPPASYPPQPPTLPRFGFDM
ncbi:hypothetical protein DL93DRAFT_759921 [Clavulina sp. PMI_390]|nr:hypothetical protein DL93DRAFT_759921 [Clavulina sp. PMI_390]